jgi:hypothetical protein
MDRLDEKRRRNTFVVVCAKLMNFPSRDKNVCDTTWQPRRDRPNFGFQEPLLHNSMLCLFCLIDCSQRSGTNAPSAGMARPVRRDQEKHFDASDLLRHLYAD